MALRGIQEYIARNANNITRVFDSGYIVSIEGNALLYPPKKAIQYLYYYSYRSLCVILLSDCRLPFCVYKQAERKRVQSSRMRRVIIVGHPKSYKS